MLSMAGCFGPDAREGLRCSRAGDCPPGQDCYETAEGQICASQPPVDAAGGRCRRAPFGAPELVELVCPELACLSPRDPSLNGDRTQLVFTVQTLNAVGDHDIYMAFRANPEDPFDMAAPAGMINSLLAEEGSALSEDGLTLFFTPGRSERQAGPPYGNLFESSRTQVGDAFDIASEVPGVVNTSFGNERGAAANAEHTRLVFGRALDLDLPDHDLYLARAGGAQWDTVERLDTVSHGRRRRAVGRPGRGAKLLFVSRGDRILEARWEGDELIGAEVVAVHTSWWWRQGADRRACGSRRTAARSGSAPAARNARSTGRSDDARRAISLPLVLAAACFSPEVRDGLPCSESGDCPPGQDCMAGICTSGTIADASPIDGPAADASPPDPPGEFGAAELIPLTCPSSVACADVREPFLANGTTAILFSNVVQASPGNQNLLLATRATAEGASARPARWAKSTPC